MTNHHMPHMGSICYHMPQKSKNVKCDKFSAKKSRNDRWKVMFILKTCGHKQMFNIQICMIKYLWFTDHLFHSHRKKNLPQ
ncbi:hypothetical protein TorRG33x02_134780 [Trema orientale]|uniref:Uncharacterized protein n=1 Tax=Trema orientale TaxID=63057 RepID=A0A2P5EZ87_TREOI|nr:hypothetical protein TorRG33x02_134780 [Trema orientale]